MTDKLKAGYDYKYTYDRHKVTYLSGVIDWDVNYLERWNLYGDVVAFHNELAAAFPNTFWYIETDLSDESQTQLTISFPSPLKDDDKTLLDTTVFNHQNNVADMWAVYYPETKKFVPSQFTNIIMTFATQEEAQQYITDNGLSDCLPVAIVDWHG